MRTPARILASLALLAALALPAAAGDMDAPSAPAPPPNEATTVTQTAPPPSIIELLEAVIVVLDLLP